jgi:pimeloyl-ACP methyl ester carboxylesterase
MTDKIPLLLLPGLLCDKALWQHQIKSLKSMTECRVADLTGHDNIPALAAEALKDAPKQFALAGLSMGGYVAFEILRQAPARVLKLCLLDTSARPDTPEQKERRKLLIALSKRGQFKGVTPRLLPMLIHADRLEDKSITQIIFDMAARIGQQAFTRQQMAIIGRVDSRPFLSSIRVPVQIITGRQDALTPPEIGQEIANGIPGARFTIVEHSGHLSPLEQPEVVSAIMRKWLTD